MDKVDLENQVTEIERELKETEQRFRELQDKGRNLLASAKTQIDANRLSDIRTRLGI